MPILETTRPSPKALSFESLETWPDPIAVARNGVFAFVNQSLVQYLGFRSAREFEGRQLLDFVHPDDRNLSADRMESAVRGGMANPPLERRLLRRDGTILIAEISSAIYGSGDSHSLVILLRDVTRRGLRSEAFSRDRISLTTLAAGIAHEINNPLAYLMTNLEFVTEEIVRTRRLLTATAALAQIPGGAALLQAAPRLAEVEEALADALGGAERVRQIVKNLRSLSRDESARKQPMELTTAIDAALEVLANEIRHRARLVRDLHEAPRVEANQTQLCQVLVNLLTNAVQAIEKGAVPDNEIRVVSGTDPRGWAFVEIRDTGVGLSPEVQDRMFDLFFTTKPLGAGQGLGLSVSHALIDGMGGEISAEPNAPQGAVFRVALPPMAAAAMPAPTAAPAKRRVLIVDDEEGICSSLRRILGQSYETQTTTRAQEALELVRGGERYDLVLCDLMMPELTGMELHAELKRIAPEQADRMVFLTGGAFTPAAREFLDHTHNLRVDKPFNKEALRALVAERVGKVGV